MQAAVLTERRTIEMKDIPAPKLSRGQVMVAPEFVGICGTDQHVFNGEFEGRVTYPAVLGHEFGGVIVETASDVTSFESGERVVVDPILHCGKCTACHEGRFNACKELKLRGIDLQGAMAGKIVCDEEQVFRLPDSVQAKYSPMAELYSIGCHAAVRACLKPADTVAVFGAGKVGLSVIDVFRQMGTYRIFAVDIEEARLDTALCIGADRVINPEKEDPVEVLDKLTDSEGIDCAVEAVGHFKEIKGVLPPAAAAAAALRPAGRMVVLGQGPSETPFFLKPLVWKEIEIIMSRVSLGEFQRAVRMMEKGLLHPENIVTDIEPLEKAGEMFETLEKDRKNHIKVILSVGETE